MKGLVIGAGVYIAWVIFIGVLFRRDDRKAREDQP